MNTIRRHLSAIKGGRLAAAAHPAKVVSLLISDVPGDDPAAIASGPTIADPRAEALEETPKPGDARLAGVENLMIATPQRSLEAAATVAKAAGITPSHKYLEF